MASGGARKRSGPAKDPNSGRSDRAGFVPTALPAEGYRGPVPEFPLPERTVLVWVDAGDGRYQEIDEAGTEQVARRERELWEWAWRTPQACMWSQPSESWRLMAVAMWVRTFVICEGSTATAADKNSLHRFADEIGLSTAGMRSLGWVVQPDEVGEKRAEAEAGAENARKRSSRDRMKVVDGAG